jgi:hypothetical protein
VNRAELGALRNAIDTILSWPDSVRDQIAQWLHTDASKPNHADPSRVSRYRSNRRGGFKSGVEESAARERALLETMRDDPEAGVVQWAKTTRCGKSVVSMRLGRLAKRGVVERDGNGGGLPGGTLRRRRRSDGGRGSRASGARRRRMPAMANPG